MKRLSQETVVAMHSELIAQSGGLDGIRDVNMLDASINSPFHTFGGQYLYQPFRQCLHISLSHYSKTIRFLTVTNVLVFCPCWSFWILMAFLLHALMINL
jgi:hypothetical protein